MVACCPLTSYDDGPAPFVSIITPRARRPHTCCECKETIERGTIHENYIYKDGEKFCNFRTCLSCVEIRDHFACNGWIFEHVWEDLESHFFPDMKAGGPCMDGLSPAAKARLFERRLAWLEAQSC